MEAASSVLHEWCLPVMAKPIYILSRYAWVIALGALPVASTIVWGKKSRPPLLRGTVFSCTDQGRYQMRCKALLALGGLLATASVAKAEQIGALLTGYEESPSVSTTASGEFTATIDPNGAIEY